MNVFLLILMKARKVHILLYYKFVNIKNPKKFAEEHLKICKSLGIFGKVLVAKEGINGSISGTKLQAQKYKVILRKIPGFKDIIFKEELGFLHPFEKMLVRVKEQIIRLDENVNMKKIGKYISPKEFLALYKKKEDVIVLDARNDYEYKAGKFKNAVAPKIKTFREFPKVLNLLKGKKDKKIVMYCTGGIRCEKASAYLVKEGFKDVSQLEGGIITFCQEYPNTVWEGKCFVFDKRLISSVDSKNIPLTKCKFCDIPCDLYQNCNNAKCNLLMNLCLSCEKTHRGCCSPSCLSKYKQSLLKKAMINMPKRNEIKAI